MKKKFNITGLCIPHKHYMVDISDKLEKIAKLVDESLYFTINRPRQYGKTTTFYLLSKVLEQRGYVVIDTSFEGNNDIFTTREEFCRRIFSLFADSVAMSNPSLADVLNHIQTEIIDYQTLSKGIKYLVNRLGKPVVLLIDEVDKSSNEKVFLEFLGILRNKYLAREADKDITFHSVILAGVHDIKNLKLAIRDEKDSRFNSPWNVASKFEVDMRLESQGIENMLNSYCRDQGKSFDTRTVAEEIFRYTNGYPYLVSNICKVIDEEPEQVWTVEGIQQAIRQILKTPCTLFDDLIKNIENHEDIKEALYRLLLEGARIPYNHYAYEKGIIYGIFSERDHRLAVDNKIFEEHIYNYLSERYSMQDKTHRFGLPDSQFVEHGRLNMEKVLLKFQELMEQEYRNEDARFYERQGRLIFLAFIKPIINGKGFSFVEPQTRENTRMDIIITYGQKRFLIELKLWYGKSYEEKGLEQLADYLKVQKLEEGYLVVFSFGKNKKYVSEWKTVKDKKIFELEV